MSILSDRLKALREARGWSQTQVAKELGMKRSSTYANWEYGIRDPDTDTLVKLAQLYEVTTDYLVGVEAKSASSDSSTSSIDKTISDECKYLNQEDKELVLGLIRRLKK